MNIGILGAGSWGIALATLLHKKGHTLRLWEYSKADAEMLRKNREHPTKLPGIAIHNDIVIVNDIAEAFEHNDFIICAVPSQTMRSALKTLRNEVGTASLQQTPGWVIVSKGIECNTLSLMSDVLLETIPEIDSGKIVALSGPSHAEEVSRDIPTTVVAASENIEIATEVQNEFSTETFRIYTNDDLRGVELAASVKNVIALAAGICDGLGFGDNTKGALLTRGIVEMMRLGSKMGAKESTFSGLAGIGDLITTCISKHSRNRNMGELIASGLKLDQALGKMVMVAEGVETTRSVYKLSQRHEIEMPITREVYKTLFEGKSPRDAAKDLMMRDYKPEWW